MSKSVVARLRERIAEMNHDSSLQLHVRIGELERLLDAVEAARVYRQSEIALGDDFCEPHFRDKRWLAAMAKRLEAQEEFDNALAALKRSDD